MSWAKICFRKQKRRLPVKGDLESEKGLLRGVFWVDNPPIFWVDNTPIFWQSSRLSKLTGKFIFHRDSQYF